ncbi:MAG: T9SS type A sorting domain-containing protein [Candidatus Krumholzibacteria bacterium]|nr:T9SS type A sorting domain-containing protein [Candidatus Krumholzibacteria bacterium]
MRHHQIIAWLILASALIASAAPRARTWLVPTDAPTIQAGIDSALAGDTVAVDCGTYYEYNITMKSGVVLRSQTGLADCVTIDAQDLDRVMYCPNAAAGTVIDGITMTAGNTTAEGGGLYAPNSDLTITDCAFIGNTGNSAGGGISATGPLRVTDCVFSDNWAWLIGGGAVRSQNSSPVFTRCVFANNEASYAGAVRADYALPPSYPPMVFDQCTLVGNEGVLTVGAVFANGILVQVNRSIVAFGLGPAPFWVNNPITFTCTDIYGNAGGDWVGSYAGQLGTNGNISADPEFCDVASGNYHLAGSSPCLAACGQMGVHGRGCFGETAGIISIADIGHDQGGQVRLRWERSQWDAPADTIAVTEYEVHRRQDAFLAASASAAPLTDGWDYLGSVPAHGDSVYQFIAPTLCDSTIAAGMCWSAFMIRTATSDPFLYFDSRPDSGYSVDNLSPAPPSGLSVAYNTGGGNALAWDEAAEPDFDYFNIYRGTDPGFVPAPGNLLHQTSVHAWTDPSGDWSHHYKVSAVDFSGNEGEASGMETATGVREEPLPARFALHQNVPNPFNPATTIRYDLAGDARVTLRVYDVSGRVVRVLRSGAAEPAGRREATWDGRSDAGRAAASGVYFYRLEAGDYTETERMVLLR